jgi:hypothetical protein
MYYFKFTIPKNKDGSVATYSPGWCGTRDKCALNEKGLLYNDKELWGIGQADGDYIPDDVEVLEEAEALGTLTTMAMKRNLDGIYFGEKLERRYDPETIKEEIEDTPESLKEESKVAKRVVVDTFAQSCPICHKMVAYVVKYEDGSCKIVQNGRTLIDGIKAKEINLMCPDNHKVVLNG